MDVYASMKHNRTTISEPPSLPDHSVHAIPTSLTDIYAGTKHNRTISPYLSHMNIARSIPPSAKHRYEYQSALYHTALSRVLDRVDVLGLGDGEHEDGEYGHAGYA